MIEFLQKHGFLGVFLMSAWPNMAFDLCGICCGHFLMPFWTFFGATLLGKAGVKVVMQACFFTMLFTESALDRFVHIISVLTPQSWAVGDKIHTALVTVSSICILCGMLLYVYCVCAYSVVQLS
jgi:vacuole membrane protein 1